MGREMLLPMIAGLLLGAAAIPPEEFRTDFEMSGFNTNLGDSNYRLTDAVQPREVHVHLDVNLLQASFTGQVRLDVEVMETNLTQIVLHQKVVSISTVSVVDALNRPVNLQFPHPFTVDDHYEILLINIAQPLLLGNYSISIAYIGKINENQFERGFYRGYYFGNNNQIQYYATTQFQPYYARMAFPCFDEPQFKSRYTISITRDSGLNPSYSNMAIAQTTVSGTRVTETFEPTPIISAYLIAFTVSDFVATNITASATKPFQIISRPGVTDQHEYAAHMGLAITNALDDYLGIEYYEMGQGSSMKNDHLAIPDFPAGAMENWGMVNYREAYLLYDEQNTNLPNKIFITTILAHELAHKWFGNLVTCFWWSNLWLNESFASLFEYFSAHQANPSLELDDQFVIDQVHSALNWDGGAGATPMNLTTVANNPSISGHFSTTSYAKGASVLRMMEHFLGERTFRMALRYYLREKAYGIGTPEDLYAAFNRAASEDVAFRRDFPNVDVGEILDSWVQNAGSPVVNIDVNMATGLVNITQERFLISGNEPSPQLWKIPLTLTNSRELNFHDTRPRLIFDTPQMSIQNPVGHIWVIANIAQSGLYRVNYDDHNWEMIASYLRNNNNRLNVNKLNRAQIVNDVLHFLRANKITKARAFDVLTFLRSETDYYVWAAGIGQFEWIRRRFEHLPNGHISMTRYLLRQINTVANHLGYEERATDSTSTILNRMQIMNLACNLGHEGCIANSLAKWNSFKANASNVVPVNQRRYVYCVGLREGDETDYQYLHARYMTSQNTADMVVMLRALACTRHNISLISYLEDSLSNDRIRYHDRTNAFSFALQGNRENVDIVMDFLFERFAEIRNMHGGTARLNVNLNNLGAFMTTYDQIQRFRDWLNANQLELGDSFQTGVNAMNTAISNIEWGTNNALEIHTILLAGKSAIATTSFVLLLAAAVVHLLF